MLKSKSSRWLAGPYLLWMAIFTIVPLLIVIWYAMTNADGQFTLDNLTQIGRYSSVFARSLILAAISTVVCLVMAFPVGYFLSRLRANKQHIMLMLIMLPMWMNFLLRTYVILVFCFMYLPIAVMIAFSFNESKSRSNFTGFTLGWYKSLFHNEMILSALGLSLVLALVSSVIATVLGTLATIGINSMSRKSQLIVNNISYVPVVNPEIITGVSLMLLFVMAQNFGIGGESGIFGWTTLLIAHITFNIPYVIFNVGPKLRQLDPSLYNAALDLGCTPKQAFMKVIMPQLSPAILSAFLICLTYSIDDFMISYFNSGTMQTLPIAIYSMTRKKVSPEINALSAVIFCVILAIILISNAADSRAYRRNQNAIRKAMADEGGR